MKPSPQQAMQWWKEAHDSFNVTADCVTALAELAASWGASQAQQTTEPELPIGVASIFVSASGEREFDDWRMELPQGRSDLFTAAQLAAVRVQAIEECAKVALENGDGATWEAIRALVGGGHG